MSQLEWQPINQPGQLFERIVAQTKQLIEDKALRAGDRLPPERDLARLLGVSRASLREAIKTLEARGQLEVRHGQGVFVRSPETMGDALRAELLGRSVDVPEFFAMREVLEVTAAGWAAGAVSARYVSDLEQMVEELDRHAAIHPPDIVAIRRDDVSIHLLIAKMTGNQFLLRTMGVLQDMLNANMETTLVLPGRLERASREHHRIVKAISEGNQVAARRAMRVHIRNARAAAVSRLETSRKGLR